MDQFKVYHEYIRNNKMAMVTINKCKISEEQFQNIFTQVSGIYYLVFTNDSVVCFVH